MMLTIQVSPAQSFCDYVIDILRSFIKKQEGIMFDSSKTFDLQYIEQSKKLSVNVKSVCGIVFDHLAEDTITDIDKAFIIENICRMEVNKHWRIYALWGYIGADISDHQLRWEILSGIEKWQVNKQYAAEDLAKLRELFFQKYPPVIPVVINSKMPVRVTPDKVIKPEVEVKSQDPSLMVQRLEQEKSQLKADVGSLRQEQQALFEDLRYVEQERTALASQNTNLQSISLQTQLKFKGREQEISNLLAQNANQKLTIEELSKHNLMLKEALKRALQTKKGQALPLTPINPTPCRISSPLAVA